MMVFAHVISSQESIVYSLTLCFLATHQALIATTASAAYVFSPFYGWDG
ncbi:hypothetical protein APHCRT_0802 [Anaplasma phagocytophilum str. CRT53-1]|uniref:Uncharacterized protein n=1 Tax=Anaplasma phagocytophilum str. CRT53-1 TaxID=1359157 RepID=A0A0F3Q475_ANAPH|nr:hypothetical protein APHCRT_0802 [Anaplasma phagocytophilum str. CRT53-1]